jgi:hypothetical protein
MASSLPVGIWRLGALLELPRDMHCSHELLPDAPGARVGGAWCAECRQVLELVEELRAESAS